MTDRDYMPGTDEWYEARGLSKPIKKAVKLNLKDAKFSPSNMSKEDLIAAFKVEAKSNHDYEKECQRLEKRVAELEAITSVPIDQEASIALNKIHNLCITGGEFTALELIEKIEVLARSPEP